MVDKTPEDYPDPCSNCNEDNEYDCYKDGIEKGRQMERERIVEVLRRKEWFGEPLSPNQRIKVLNWLKEGK